MISTRFWTTLIAAGLCSFPAFPADKSGKDQQVADLHVVDCLLPSMVRRIGNTNYTSPRRPIRTTAADCRRRRGEYTDFDQASLASSLDVWLEAAEDGDPAAQATVGELYEKGQGGLPDYTAAAKWYALAAEQGNSRAQYNLGSLHEHGRGVKRDRVAALKWYRLAWGITDNSGRQVALQESLERREARIRELESQLARLEARQDSEAANQASLLAEIEDLRLWIDALESERDAAVARVDTTPRTRDSQATGQIRETPMSGEMLKLGDLEFGRYFALVIGNQDYSKIEDLETPKKDARKIADVLQRKYGFAVELLLDASNVEVMERINDINASLDENDNLLIYYAGHGARVMSGEVESGYWLPVNADAPPRNTYWVSNEFVTGHLSRIRARRVMVVADSCYAGLLSNAPGYLMLQGSPDYTEELIRYKLPRRSRLLLASGGDRPVLDSGSQGHSVFAAVLLETLEKNDAIMSGPQLFRAIDEEVRRRSTVNGYPQAAEYKVIKSAGHEVGDFFFVPI